MEFVYNHYDFSEASVKKNSRWSFFFVRVARMLGVFLFYLLLFFALGFLFSGSGASAQPDRPPIEQPF